MHTPTTSTWAPRGASAIDVVDDAGHAHRLEDHQRLRAVDPAPAPASSARSPGRPPRWRPWWRRGPGGRARSRRRRCSPRRRGATRAITARPTGPQPSTTAACRGVTRLISTACRPTAIGSVERGEPRVEPVGHLHAQHVRQHEALGVATRVLRGVADGVHAGGVHHDRHRHHHVVGLAVAHVLAHLEHPRRRTRGPSRCRGRGRRPRWGSRRRGRPQADISAKSSAWCSVCRSDPQIPQASTSAVTWPGAGGRSGNSSTTSSPLRMMTACMVDPRGV